MKQRCSKLNMLRLIIIITDYPIPYDNYNTPEAQSTVGYGDRLKQRLRAGRVALPIIK